MRCSNASKRVFTSTLKFSTSTLRLSRSAFVAGLSPFSITLNPDHTTGPPAGAVGRFLERRIRLDDAAPHVRDGRVVVAQALGGLSEVPADDIGEFLDGWVHIRVERVQIVHGHK